MMAETHMRKNGNSVFILIPGELVSEVPFLLHEVLVISVSRGTMTIKRK